MLETLVLALFSVTNTFRILAYVPQIVRAATDVNGASAISFMTWGLFALSNFSTAAYAAIVLRDTLMLVIFSGNALACCVVVAVTFMKRRRHAAHCRFFGEPHGAAKLRLVPGAASDAGPQCPQKCGSAHC